MIQSDRPAAGRRGDTLLTAVDPDPDPEDVDIIALANQPDVDECDVVCDALPALSCNDLTVAESDWISEHVATCKYCATEMDRFQHVCDQLDQVYKAVDVGPCPAPRFIPVRQPAWYQVIPSPVGPLFVAATDEALVEIEFSKGRSEADIRRHLAERGFEPRPLADARRAGGAAGRRVVDQTVAQLSEYFGGKRNDFDLPLDLSGLSPFTRDVLEATAKVPFGHLDTYRGIATRIGRPEATRAVGNALNRNPIPLVVPCHRVIRSDGSAGGYGGGVDIKFQLLKLEGVPLSGMRGAVTARG